MATKDPIRLHRMIGEMGDFFAKKQGMTRRQFLRTTCGLAMTFLAMNKVYGPFFTVDAAEIADKDAANERRRSLDKQFIFDAQLHFVQDAYPLRGILDLRQRAKSWNPELKNEEVTLERIKFENFFKEVFIESQTKIGLLSSAPADDPTKWFITNGQISRARQTVNSRLGARRLLSHAVFTPGQPGWLEEVDRAIEEFKPDGWKGYTIGDPMNRSRYPWRLDDEKRVYPAYEKMAKAGIRNVCIHKGLLPPNHREVLPDLWRFGTVEDLGKAAKDWPGLNFIIYHSALETLSADPRQEISKFEKTGRVPWVTDLAEIPQKYEVKNVYGEIGTSFAATSVSNPAYCAAILGTLIKGLGVDHVIWGTDSVWYGSPQWQIEAMRRIEIPETQKKHGFSPLGPADGPVKNAIFGMNSARLYNVKLL